MAATGNTVFLSPVFNGTAQLRANGFIATNAALFAYVHGSSTNANTYTGNTGQTLNPNPLHVNPRGLFTQQIWLPQGQFTDFILIDTDGTVLDTQNNVLGLSDPTFASTSVNNASRIAALSYSTANVASNGAVLALLSANGAQAEANSGANTVAVYTNANSNTLMTASNLNFFNSATINVTASVNASATIRPQVNVSLTLNSNSVITTTANGSANGWVNLSSNIYMQWGNVHCATAASPVSINFPEPFPVACWTVQLSSDSDGSGDNFIPRPFDVTGIGFQLYFDAFGGTFPANGSNIFYMAVGS